TTISFSAERDISGMGIITNSSTMGFMLHSSLLVDAADGEIFGLAGQTIHYRQPRPKGETQRQSLLRKRESEIWGELIEQIGPATNDRVRFTHVCDRGGDNFEVYCQCLRQRVDWVIRAGRLTRLVQMDGQTRQLNEHLQTLPLAGTYELDVPENEHQIARSAKLEVRFATIALPRPRDCGRLAKASGIVLMTMNVVEVREANPPKGVTPLHWVLLTSHEVSTFDQAFEVIEYYERRPLVEEFHKGLKTGCRIEDRLYETAARWENVAAMLSIVAVRLLQLKTVATKQPDQPAEAVAPTKWIKSLDTLRGPKKKPITTARD